MATYRYGPNEKNLVQITAGDTLELLVWAFDSTTPTTPKTGLAFGSVTVTVCKPAGTGFAAWPASPGWGTGNWAEVGNGCYRLIFTGSVAAELALLDTVGPILFHLSASGAIFPEVCRTIVVTAVARVDANALVQADVARIGTVAQTMTDLKDFADTGYDPSTHKIAGVVTTDTATAATSVTNQVTADVTAIHGTALTETDAGHLAAAFVKLFDVHTPVLVASDVMRGTDSAALASNWTEGRAALIDQLNGATDGTLCEIVKTVLTELSNRTYNPSLHDLLGIPDETAHTLLTEIAAGNVVNVTGDVQGKVIGGGASTITGVGTWADLRQILGAMITGTAAQIVAAFTKWFNVATPTGTVNSIPDAVAGATSGLSIVGSAMALTSVERTAIGNALAAIDLAAGAIDYEAAMATGTTVGAFLAACRAALVGKMTAPSATAKRYYDAAGTAHYIAQTHGADYTTRETPTQG